MRDEHEGRVHFESVGEGRVPPLRLARLAGLTVSPIDCEIGDLRTANGMGLRFAIEETILTWLPGRCHDLLGASPLVACDERLPEARVQRYLLKAAAALIRPTLTMAMVARARGAADVAPVLVIDEVVAVLLQGHPALAGFDLRTYGQPPSGMLALRLAGWWQAARAWMGAVAWNARGITRSRLAPSAQIAVQWHAGFAAGGQLRDCPWLLPSGIAPSRVTLYADRPDSPLTRRDAQRLASASHTWVNCRSRGAGDRARGRWSGWCSIGGWRLWTGARRAVAAAAASGAPLIQWEWAQRIRLSWQVSLWEAWCRRHRVAVLMQWADTGTTMLAQSIAVERAGGISAAFQWSHYSFDTIDHARDFDVFFAWGPYYLAGFEREGSRISKLVYVGHVTMRDDVDGAHEYRQRLEAAGAARVICLFDSSVSPDIHYSANALRELYEAFFALVVADGSIGLLLKPKKEGDSFVRSVVGYAAAAATGRLLCLDHAVSPRTAALAADLAVGFGFNSAAIEAAIAGLPAIHADLSGDRTNPLHVRGTGSIAFTDVPALMRAVRQRLEHNAGPLGDHTPVLSEISKFGDSKGAQRVGWFLRAYIDRLDAGDDRSAALAHVTAAYRDEFGPAAASGPSVLELLEAC